MEVTSTGERVHRIRSSMQAADTRLRVLLPQSLRPDERLRVMYVLPVEAGDGQHYGDGLTEILRHSLHEKYRLLCVAPTFSDLPWYADHPTNPELQQEGYLLRGVLPFIDKHYPTLPKASHRWLLGFSKSGWGAFSLLLRHPDSFGKAVAWDAPLMMDAPGKYGSGPIFGTKENFAAYQLTELLRRQQEPLREQPVRLIHFGYGNFREAHELFEQELQRLRVPHRYLPGEARPHTWGSGWVVDAVAQLAADEQP